MPDFHFEFVTHSGAVIHSGAEEFPNALAAAEMAKAWMEERTTAADRTRVEGMVITTDTFEGGATSIRCAEIEHVNVLTPDQAAAQTQSFFPSTVAPAQENPQ